VGLAVTQLGSIFEPEAPGPRGRDLHADVTVPAWALGLPFGYEVQIPLELAAEGGYARRVVSALDAGDRLRLALPAGFRSGGVLRLRGQGEALEGGKAGDLLVHVDVDRRRSEPPAEVAALLAAMAATPSPEAGPPLTYRLPLHGPHPIDATTLTWLAAALAVVVGLLLMM
jgi:hypothetical protein